MPIAAPMSGDARTTRRRSADATKPGPNPSAFRVAYSPSRSRAVIAIVFAITARMMKMTTNETMRIATTIASVMRDEAELERLLGLGQRLRERVRELAVDRLR